MLTPQGCWETAWADFKGLDEQAQLHGSRRLGIACADSDAPWHLILRPYIGAEVDVVSSLALEELVESCSSKSSSFQVLEHVRS